MLDTENAKQSPTPSRLSPSRAKVKSSGSAQLFCDFFGYLAFQGHGVRIGLEITASLFMFIAITESLPSSGQASSVHWVTLAAWFAACGAVAAADWLVFSQPRQTYRTSLRLGLCGSYDKAIALLDTIGPQSTSFIRCPKLLYHLRRCDLLTHAGKFAEAQQELEIVGAIGSAKEIAETLSIRLRHASRGSVETTLEQFSQACVNYPKSASLALEKAIFLIEARSDFWHARRELDKVCSMQDELHLSGESTRILAEAFKSAAMLWTGAAEEGLEALERSLVYLLNRSRTCESLRPLLAVILLERSFYWATHGDKKASVCDLSEALANCAYPQLEAKAELIREEIRWRFESTD